MRIPNLPENLDVGSLANLHSEIATLVANSPDAKKLANLIVRASLPATGQGRANQIPKWLGAVILNGFSPVDGFAPLHLSTPLVAKMLLDPEMPKDRKLQVAITALSHPDKSDRATADAIASTVFSAEELKVARDKASAIINDQRALGIDSQSYFKAVDAKADREAQAQVAKIAAANVKVVAK